MEIKECWALMDKKRMREAGLSDDLIWCRLTGRLATLFLGEGGRSSRIGSNYDRMSNDAQKIRSGVLGCAESLQFLRKLTQSVGRYQSFSSTRFRGILSDDQSNVLVSSQSLTAVVRVNRPDWWRPLTQRLPIFYYFQPHLFWTRSGVADEVV